MLKQAPYIRADAADSPDREFTFLKLGFQRILKGFQIIYFVMTLVGLRLLFALTYFSPIFHFNTF